MGGGKKSPAPPQLQAPREVPLSETFAKFLGQEAQVPALQGFADRLNQQFRQSLEAGLPGTLGATTQVSSLVNQLLSGVIPSDVQTQVQRTAAERAAAVGAPATSEFARMLEARDIGTTSLGLQQQGVSYTPGLMQLSEFLTPQQVQNYLFSTGQLREEALTKAQQDAQVANQNAINKYNYDVANARSSGGIFGSIGGLLGGIAGSVIAPGIGTTLGAAIGGGLGNLAGGGGFQLGAGQAAGLVPAMGGIGSSLFGGGLLGGGGGLMGGGRASQGFSSTAFSPTGQAFSLPATSFSQPVLAPNWPFNQIGATPVETFGGRGMSGLPGY
jgi:hypothetical protein